VEIQYLVHLSAEQRQACHAILNRPSASCRARRRALVLLNADRGAGSGHQPDAAIAQAAGVDVRTVVRVRAAFVKQGFGIALNGRARSATTTSKLTPEQETRLLALIATPPPPGYPRWTIRTLAEGLRQFSDMPRVSRELVRRTLNRHNAALWQSERLERAEAS
jgi:hypothetical protein